MRNALSVDLEDWYHICGAEGLSDPRQWDTYEQRVVRNTDRVLGLLSRYEAKATFFVLGYIAGREPDLIRAIKNEGHELATHGYFHRRVFELTEEEFEEDVRRSIEEIAAAAGGPVIGFRAPEWSIRPETPWALAVLRKLGILYDSSMVPLTRMGSRSFPRLPTVFSTPYGDIREFPLTTVRFFTEHIPFSGGLPLRMTPYFYIAALIAKMNRCGTPALVYLHPWEFDSEQPPLDLPPSRKLMHYFNLKAAPRKIEGLLRRFRFSPLREVLGLAV